MALLAAGRGCSMRPGGRRTDLLISNQMCELSICLCAENWRPRGPDEVARAQSKLKSMARPF